MSFVKVLSIIIFCIFLGAGLTLGLFLFWNFGVWCGVFEEECTLRECLFYGTCLGVWRFIIRIGNEYRKSL